MKTMKKIMMMAAIVFAAITANASAAMSWSASGIQGSGAVAGNLVTVYYTAAGAGSDAVLADMASGKEGVAKAAMTISLRKGKVATTSVSVAGLDTTKKYDFYVVAFDAATVASAKNYQMVAKTGISYNSSSQNFSVSAAFGSTWTVMPVAKKGVSVTVTSGVPYILGVKYQKEASATPGKISLNDLITLSDSITPGTFASDFANAPVVRVLKEEEQGYKHYYYISDATVKGSDTAVGHNTWADMNGDEVTADDDLALGQGFVFQASQSGTLTLDGEEYTGTDLVSPKNLKAGKFYLLSNNQPKEFTFTKLASTHNPGEYESDFAGASEIMVMRTSGGYDHYYWISDATDSDDEPLNYNTWSDMDGYLLDGNQIDAAKGFWLKTTQDCSISIKQ